jgi:hypothetical protein
MLSIADGLLRHRQQRRRHGEIGCLAADHSIFRPPFLPINTLPRNVRILHRPRIVRPWRSLNDAEHPSRACIDRRVSLIGVRPWNRTGLRGGFDRLPGVVVLELSRTQIAECGVEPASVVDLVDGPGRSARRFRNPSDRRLRPSTSS